MKKWLKAAVLSIVLMISFLAFAGWAFRPVIEYSLETLPDSINFSYGVPMIVDLFYRNDGNIDADLNLTLTATNSNVLIIDLVTNGTGSDPYFVVVSNSSQGAVHVSGNMAIAHSHGGIQVVHVYPYGNPPNFTIKYTVVDTSPIFSMNGLISHLFLERRGNLTEAVYVRTGDYQYQLLK
jgi:hypothetical protein